MRLAVALLLMALPVRAAELSVTITGVRNDQGLVEVCLFSGPTGFPDCSADPGIQRRRLPAVPGTVRTSFDIPPGTYAVTVFHDEKRLGRVETNFLGIPRSGVGASRDPEARFGPPPFADAAFVMGDRPAAVSVRLRYP